MVMCALRVSYSLFSVCWRFRAILESSLKYSAITPLSPDVKKDRPIRLEVKTGGTSEGQAPPIFDSVEGPSTVLLPAGSSVFALVSWAAIIVLIG